ncbi:MAG: trehalose-phosphatase [Chloroflexi bacterium]|nr:trehalose-phosphatase [Chloroflexota bacterium]
MQHLFSVWPEVAQRLKAARGVLLFSDYDGTLTPIVDRPELADLPAETRRLLRALAHRHRFTVGIISGRALSDLKHRVGIESIVYAGNHGLEIEGPGISFINPLAEEMKPVLRLIHQALSKALATVRGSLVEDKGLSLSVHYRRVEEKEVEKAKTIFERILHVPRLSGMIKVTSGKKVHEVRPAVDWDKGKAIKLLMRRYGKGGRRSGLLPIYLGDDLTDEDGFRAIERYGDGLTVFVGGENDSTVARYFLRSPHDVERFLSMLLDL